MLQNLSSIAGLVFPERQIHIRSGGRDRQIVIPTAWQAVSAAALVSCIVALGGVETHFALTRHRLANEVAALQTQLEAAQRAAETARLQLQQLAAAGSTSGTTAEQPSALARRIAARIQELEQQLAHANAQQAALEAERKRLGAETGKLENKLSELSAVKRAQHNIASERDKLRERVALLEKKLKHGGRLIAPARARTAKADEAGGDTADEGFDVDGLLSKLGVRMKKSGVGGPYVAAGSARRPAEVDPETRAVLKTLPLSAPLDHYAVESGFGVREDPFTGNEAMHTGVDLSAPYRSPVYSTSPGEVVFAGYAAGYGKLVEIDHGRGIHTRYAHLNRLMVNVGQHVGRHAEIGLLGSTGRSTGPHVHYEVLVNGAAEDPQKFLAAGRAVGGTVAE